MACRVSFSRACCSSMGKRGCPGRFVIPLEFLFRASHFYTWGKVLAGCISYGQEVVMTLWLNNRAELCQCRLSRVLGTVRVTPSTLPQTVGVRLLVHPRGSTFSVDDTQFRSSTGASFRLWWLRSCQRAVRLGDELFFPKLGGDCSLGLWAGHCGVAAVGMGRGVGWQTWCSGVPVTSGESGPLLVPE